jgi:hypothetical protein
MSEILVQKKKLLLKKIFWWQWFLFVSIQNMQTCNFIYHFLAIWLPLLNWKFPIGKSFWLFVFKMSDIVIIKLFFWILLHLFRKLHMHPILPKLLCKFIQNFISSISGVRFTIRKLITMYSTKSNMEPW